MKILNLYAGIGGNRKAWGNDHEITAVELDPTIAKIYKDHFPNDEVITGDAHEYPLKHFKEFDFIWASPPCPTHSDIRRLSVDIGKQDAVYPDMTLYQEIILLKHFFDGLYCVENVRPYYDPLISPQIRGRHCFWANFYIPEIEVEHSIIDNMTQKIGLEKTGFDLSNYSGIDKRKTYRNCVDSKLAKHILDSAIKNRQGEFNFAY